MHTDDTMEVTSDPQALLEMLREQKEEQARRKKERYEALSAYASGKRDEAVAARKASGIEDVWREDENYCEGVDEYNSSTAQYNKPRDASGQLVKVSGGGSDNQCTKFFNITRQFVDSGTARVGDILLPSGEFNFGIKESPVVDQLQEQQQDGIGGELQQTNDAQGDVAEKVRRGETRIKDWLTESGYHREYRRCIEASGKIGTGVLKGPYPIEVTSKAVINGELVRNSKIAPGVREVSAWDSFPDMACGDDIQKGDYFFERDYLTAKRLQDLRKIPGFDPDAINKVIKEKPKQKLANKSNSKQENGLFEVWYFTGNIDVADLDLIDEDYEQSIDIEEGENGELSLCGCEEKEREKEFKSVVLVLVNDTIIKGHLNPLDNGRFPYVFMCWEKQSNSPFGIGIARQGRVSQEMLLTSARSLMDNMGLSSTPMMAMRRSGVEPENGTWEIKKGKVWWLTDDAIKTLGEAIQFLEVPARQTELMEMIALAGKMFEDATGINSLLLGQQGAAPDTVGGMELLNRNASALLRRIGRISDEDVTKPLIDDFYDWLLVHGEDNEKGDFEIQAIGSSVLIEREIQAQQAQVLLQYSSDPGYELSKPKIMSEVLRGWRMEPTRVMMDEKEKEALKDQQPPPDPRIQVAQMKAETDLQIADMKTQEAVEKMRMDTDRDTVFKQSVAERDRMNYESRIAELQLKRELAMLDYANKNQMNLDDIKASLASDAMKINLQKELAMGDTKPAEQVITPPSEPAGRAPDGQAFQR